MCRLGIRVCWNPGGLKKPISISRCELGGEKILLPDASPDLDACLFPQILFNGGLQNGLTPHIPSTLAPPMFEQHISSDILFHHEDNKIISGNLYLRQPHTVIQLVEVASPPPRRISSVINSSSAASSSYTSSSSFFEENQGEEEEEEEESIHSSYCSSDAPLDELEVPVSPRTADSLSGRMKRILLWREQSPHRVSGMRS